MFPQLTPLFCPDMKRESVPSPTRYQRLYRMLVPGWSTLDSSMGFQRSESLLSGNYRPMPKHKMPPDHRSYQPSHSSWIEWRQTPEKPVCANLQHLQAMPQRTVHFDRSSPCVGLAGCVLGDLVDLYKLHQPIPADIRGAWGFGKHWRGYGWHPIEYLRPAKIAYPLLRPTCTRALCR